MFRECFRTATKGVGALADSFTDSFARPSDIPTPALHYDPLADRVQDYLRNAVQIQLLQNVGAVRVHGVQAEVQRVGDLLVGFAVGNMPKNLDKWRSPRK